MTDKFYIKDLKSDYKKITIICIHADMFLRADIFPAIKTSIVLAELKKIGKEISQLSTEFKNNYDQIPWGVILNTSQKITSEDVENNGKLFMEVKLLIKKIKKVLNDLSYQEIKKLEPKWSTDYKDPIKSKSSVKPVRK